ncbi:hypothetical protein [Streptomyces californicus]|uniref:hypothetical protein n=1 Tax=Streptomyces californicus TaxID=67351 RepID=UPI0036B01933
MILWIRARRAFPVLVPGLLVFLAVITVGRQENVLLPGLINSGRNHVQLVHFAPLIVTSTLAHCLAQRLAEAELTTVRRIRLLDVGLVTVTTALAVSASCLVAGITHTDLVYEAGRNTLFLVGLMLIAGGLHPQAATLSPVAWVFAAMFAGYRDYDRPWIWAVTLHPAHIVVTACFCLLVFTAGLVVGGRSPRSS